MQAKKQQLELNIEQQTGSKLGKEYIKAVYSHPAYLIYMQNKVKLVAQSCLALCDPMDCSPPGAPVLGILQARILERVAISFSMPTSIGPQKKAREFQKNIYFCFIDYTKTFVWITTSCGKF